MSSINSLFLLTDYTGRTSNQGRTTVIGTVEMKLRTAIIGGIALVPAFLLMLIVMPFVGTWSILAVPAVLGLTFLLIEGRSKEGLRLRTYQTMRDKYRSHLNEFRLCGEPIDPSGAGFGYIRQMALPTENLGDAKHPAPADVIDFEALTR